jgi:hypothetical protein
MMSAWECLALATLELVRSTPIKQRLMSAYRRHLISLPADKLPAEGRELFGQVMATLQGVEPLRGEDAVAASVRKLSNQEAEDCAALIVEIFGVTSRALLDNARSNAVVQLRGLEQHQKSEYENSLINT